MNLVTNAIKYTPAGGKVVIRLSEDEGSVSLQVQDVTERRRARREINLRHEASRALFDADDIVAAAPDALAPMADLMEASLATLWLAEP